MYKKSLVIILYIFIISSFLVCVNVDQVLSYDFEAESGLKNTGIQTGHTGEGDDQSKTVPEIVGQAISVILTFLGVIFLILMIYGGYIWMMARGNEQGVEKAKNIIKNALIGLVVVLAAYAITWFITNEFSPWNLREGEIGEEILSE